PTFCDLPAATLETLGDAQVAILGAAHGTPYNPGVPSHSAGAPAALRSTLEWYDTRRDHIDMDRGEPLMGATRAVDIGDADTNPDDTGAANRAAIAQAVAAVRAQGAVPILLGGDDSVPIPFFEGFAGENVWIVQVDAHIDWRDEVEGVTHGFSSTMRRASEMDQIQGIVQIGARGMGSARAGEVEVARNWGAKLFPMRQIHAEGLGSALEAVPEGANIILTTDVDGLDPALCPAALSAEFGGIGYQQMLDIIEGCGARGRIVGATMIEFVPERDPHGLAAKAVARILCNLIAEIGAGG
ncbi:MAG: arginase family protein, partial [Paracoccaceae bacterium]|nr:arginase family protein [Paracoccaceae bacterium]